MSLEVLDQEYVHYKASVKLEHIGSSVRLSLCLICSQPSAINAVCQLLCLFSEVQTNKRQAVHVISIWVGYAGHVPKCSAIKKHHSILWAQVNYMLVAWNSTSKHFTVVASSFAVGGNYIWNWFTMVAQPSRVQMEHNVGHVKSPLRPTWGTKTVTVTLNLGKHLQPNTAFVFRQLQPHWSAFFQRLLHCSQDERSLFFTNVFPMWSN